ncbi:MAG: ABC transporter ATP-binding protein [Clostridiales bacterium]|nr:ABC transporter ATP-binding protein [Clostridiales bacterium]
MESKLLKSGKKYYLWDFISISFKVSPMAISVKFINLIITSLIPSIQVLVTASFIDRALAIFNGTAAKSSIFSPLAWMMLITIYQYLNWWLLSFVDIKLSMKLTETYRAEMVEKRARLEYRHIEDNDTWDLIKRTCGNPVDKVNQGISNILNILNIIIRVFSILTILVAQVWWAAIVIVLISVPLFMLAIKGGKATYQANKEAEKHSRRAGYLHNVLSSRDNVEERALFGYTDDLNKKWHGRYEEARLINHKAQLKHYARTKGSSLITMVISIFIIAMLLIPLSSGTITIGMFMGLVTATLNLVQMMSWQLSWTTSQLANNQEYLKDLTAFMALSEQEGALDLPEKEDKVSFNNIEFINVSFKYPGTDRYILRNFNLKLRRNLHYAFVGINGAGKTTITKLLTGM